MNTFTLTGFDSKCTRLFNVQLRLEATTVREAAKRLGCGYVETPALEGRIIQSFIQEARKDPSSVKEFLLLEGRPRLALIDKVAASPVDGNILADIHTAYRLFLTERCS